MMKIAEARRAYATQLSVQRGQRAQLLKQKEKLEQEKANRLSVSSETSGNGVSLELSDEYLQRFTELQERIDTLTDQIKKNEKSLDDVIEMEVGIANSEVAKQQGDARGDKVPAQDEKKLMDFNMEIYQIAKNMAVMNMNKKHKEWESLWEDEEEKQEYADPMETAADAEMNIAMPEGMDATAQSQEFRE